MESVSLEEKISKKILKYLSIDNQFNKIDQIKISYGLSIFIINTIKLISIYLIAYIYNCIYITFITHISFYIIRRYAYGAHAKKSYICTFLGIFMFVILPNFVSYIYIDTKSLIIINLLNFFILGIYAPAKTKKNTIGDNSKIKKFKIKAMFNNFLILLFIICINNISISVLIVLGSSLAVLLVTPISYKLLEE